jgi:tetratricopeptide (TPR) repeat protein
VWGEEGLRRAEEANHPFSVVVGCWGLGCLHLIQGVAERAIAILERGVAVAQEWDVAMQHVFVTTALGYAYVLAGRNAEGLPLLEQGVAEASRVGLMREHARRIGWLAEACLRAGHEREAFTWAERAILTAQQHLERGHEAYALRLMGEIVTEANPAQVGEAESYYSQALSLANELGMRPLAAHCHLGLGTLYLKINRREQAQAELSMAAEMYRAMEMTFWLARAEAALASLGQP